MASKYISFRYNCANIAIQVDPMNIDYVAIEKAAKIANLHEFVDKELQKNIKPQLVNVALDYQVVSDKE